MVDKAIVARKLQRIDDYLRQISRKKDTGREAFIKDRDLQSIILFNIIQAIQSCIDIGAHMISDSGWEAPSSQAEIFEVLAGHKVITKALAKKMVLMTGFRNRIVHEYEKTDFNIVYDIWRKHLSDIERFCKAVVLKGKM